VSERLGELRHLAVLERRDLREEPLELIHLVVQVRSDLEPLLKGRKVNWELGTLPRVMGDALLLRQVFAELLAVALDATQHTAAARIEVAGEVRENRVIVWVRHNGDGLTSEQAGRIFDVFQVPHAVFGAEERIGLANVRRIVARHGGQVWAEKGDDVGASLMIAFPHQI
jgi:light-regulated signal transduction histidine kinase (bacteriophytochrome)